MDAAERSVVEAALGGDRNAFETLIRRYSRAVYARAYSLLHQREEARDIVQETFLRAWRSRHTLRAPETFVSWLYTIAGNLARDAHKRKRPSSYPEETADFRDPRAGSPCESLEAREVRARLFQALSSLPERDRLAVTLRYMEGLDYKAIEQAMDVSNGALRGILGRTLSKLRVSLRTLAPSAPGIIRLVGNVNDDNEPQQ